MSHQVVWTAKTLERFETLGNLNEFQRQIMETRCKNMTVIQQAMLLGVSESTVHKEISRLKKLYDVVQSQHPDELPVRKTSSKELYMDTH